MKWTFIAALLAALVPALLLVDSVADPLTGDDYLWFLGVEQTPLPDSLDYSHLLSFTNFRRPVRFLVTRFVLDDCGATPVPFRSLGLALHAGCGLLLFTLARGMGLTVGASLVASLLFSLHARAAQPVLWVAAQAECLATFFVLLCLIAVLRFARTGRWRWYPPCILFLALGLLSKESAYIAFPVALAILVFFRREAPAERGRSPWIFAVALAVPVLAIGIFQLTWPLQREAGRTVLEMGNMYLLWVRKLVVFGRAPWSQVVFFAIALLCLVIPRSIPRVCAVWLLVAPLPFVPVYLGIETRFFYGAFAPIGLLAGALLTAAPLRLRQVAYVASVAVLLLFARGQRTMRDGWGLASELAEHLVQSVEPYLDEIQRAGRATFLNIPHEYSGGWVFNAGFPAALHFRYGLDHGMTRARNLRTTYLGCSDFTPPGYLEPDAIEPPVFTVDTAHDLQPITANQFCVSGRMLPYLFAVREWSVEPDLNRRAEILFGPGFDPRQIAVFSEAVPGLPAPGAPPARLTRLTINVASVIVEMDAPAGGVLVLVDDSPTVHWVFRLDGVEVKTVPVNDVTPAGALPHHVHALILPAGAQRLVVKGRYGT